MDGVGKLGGLVGVASGTGDGAIRRPGEWGDSDTGHRRHADANAGEAHSAESTTKGAVHNRLIGGIACHR